MAGRCRMPPPLAYSLHSVRRKALAGRAAPASALCDSYRRGGEQCALPHHGFAGCPAMRSSRRESKAEVTAPVAARLQPRSPRIRPIMPAAQQASPPGRGHSMSYAIYLDATDISEQARRLKVSRFMSRLLAYSDEARRLLPVGMGMNGPVPLGNQLLLLLLALCQPNHVSGVSR